jgi:Rad3-related DNA helicase
MHCDLDQKRINIAIGELADFSVGPREPGAGKNNSWRAQLGIQWHTTLRREYEALHPSASFEIPLEGRMVQRGWLITLNGRIDQMRETETTTILREIKTVTDPLPRDERSLREDYPNYFIQLAAYASVLENTPSYNSKKSIKTELVFVEVATGITQTVSLNSEDYLAFKTQLYKVYEFFSLQLENRDKRKRLIFNAAFIKLRQGQETTLSEIEHKILSENKALVLQAPTGFGKTGMLLEFALKKLKSAECERIIYLTSKSTGQLQVMETLKRMTQSSDSTNQLSTPVAAWNIRNKSEHCINSTFYCVKDSCSFLAQSAEKWPTSGLSRFYLFRDQAHDLETLRNAGSLAGICPYEITRTALAFQDVWVGDYNYVFSPSSEGLFRDQPGYAPEKTLLIIDEAHNLHSRVAGVYSHQLSAQHAYEARDALDRVHAPANLIWHWDKWALFLSQCSVCESLDDDQISDAKQLLAQLSLASETHGLDYRSLEASDTEKIWSFLSVAEHVQTSELPLLWWSSQVAQLNLTCLDASQVIGKTLGQFGCVILATATPGPLDAFSSACGIPLCHVEAKAPWRKNAYDIVFDTRVDTRYQVRKNHYEITAQSIARLARQCKPGRPVAVFFPSFIYAEQIRDELNSFNTEIKIAIQPKQAALASQHNWLEVALDSSEALFLILGSSFAESIDALGGKIDYTMVVSPALPEVNAVQRAKLALQSGVSQDEAFNRVYRIPGMQKINQALGRLVRSPGHKTRVVLHCKRFLDPAYYSLLSLDSEASETVSNENEFESWLSK